MPSATSEPRAPSTWVLTLVVFGAIAGIAAGASYIPGEFQVPAMILLPAIAAAALPFGLRRRFARPLRDDYDAAEGRTQRARRELADERATREALRELDRGMDHAANEQDALDRVREALLRRYPNRACELHLVEPVDPVMSLAIATSNAALPGERCSPWDSVAARSGTTLVYATTEQLDVCSHLRARATEPQAAIAIPLNATDRLLGVLYVFDREGTDFTMEVTELEDLARIVAARLAILRAAAPSRNRDAVDRLTGLPDRAAMQERVLRLLEAREDFTMAVADIDSFGALNVAHGRSMADRILELTASVCRRAMRPDDIVGRIGGDEFLIVLPRTDPSDATRALERLREELVLAQSMSDDPTITLSIGVIGSTSGGSIEALLHRAAGALGHAKAQGGNRVVVAQPAPQT